MAQDPTTNTTESTSPKVNDTFARVDAMLTNFESTKEDFNKSIHKINKAIAKGAKFRIINKYKQNYIKQITYLLSNLVLIQS